MAFVFVSLPKYCHVFAPHSFASRTGRTYNFAGMQGRARHLSRLLRQRQDPPWDNNQEKCGGQNCENGVLEQAGKVEVLCADWTEAVVDITHAGIHN